LSATASSRAPRPASDSGRNLCSQQDVAFLMEHVAAHPVRRSLGAFFVLTYAVTWTCWFLAWRLRHATPVVAGLGGPVFLLGVFTPALVALALSARADGRAGALALLRPILHWRVSAQWYLFAAGYMAAVKLIVALVLRAATDRWPQFGTVPWYLM